ncbi:MAG: hypothetical protein HDR71_07295 [Lachnospiraceae bacterium]|nr:hypothetical protein [Lachnospiraceae bacterium]
MMKNWKKELIATVILCNLLLLSGCGLKLGDEFTGEVNTLEGVELIVDQESVKPTEISYTIENQSESDLAYGQDYGLQMEKDGKWYQIIPKKDVAITLEMLWTPAGSTDTHMISWESSYGKLPKGHYRIIKSMSDDQQGYFFAGEFEIK